MKPVSTPVLSMNRFLPCLLAGLVVLGTRAADTLTPLTRLLGESEDVQVQLDVLRGLRAALDGQRQVPMPAGWAAVEVRLGASANAEVRAISQSLAVKFGSETALRALRGVASDRQAPTAARRGALDSLLAVRAPDLVPLLQDLVADPALRPQALRALAAYDDPKTSGVILAAYGGFSPAERRDALGTLASRTAYAVPLLAAVASGTVARTDLTAELVRQLRNLRDPALDRRIAEVWGVMQDTSPDMAREMERYRRIYQAGGSTPGDASRGREVFNQVCAQCHQLFDTGGKVGPDITGANRGDLNYLLENILFPNAVIPNEYRQSIIELKDGRVITGIVRQRAAGALTVQTANELVSVRQDEVAAEELVESSMMPEGLLAQLTDVQVRDLLYYLSRPGQVPLPGDAGK